MFFAGDIIFAGESISAMGRKWQQVPLVLVEISILTELHRIIGSKEDSANIMTPFFKKETFYIKAVEQYSAEA